MAASRRLFTGQVNDAGVYGHDASGQGTPVEPDPQTRRVVIVGEPRRVVGAALLQTDGGLGDSHAEPELRHHRLVERLLALAAAPPEPDDAWLTSLGAGRVSAGDVAGALQLNPSSDGPAAVAKRHAAALREALAAAEAQLDTKSFAAVAKARNKLREVEALLRTHSNAPR